MSSSRFSLPAASGALVGIVVLSVILGVLVAAAATPVLAVTGMTANTAISVFENLPSYIKPDALSQRSNLFAKNADGSPVFLASVFDQDRQMVSWDAIPQVVKDALVSTEDPRFYSHGGVDVQSSVRALVENTASGGVTSGASTISMQYVKNILVQRAEAIVDPTARQTAYAEAIKTSTDRKLKEMKLAIGLEKEYSKDAILLGYLNIALFGGRVYGIEAAAEYYFGVPASQLTLPQAASLIGTVQNPDNFRIDEPENIPANTNRRDYVLGRMLIEHRITQEQHDDAVATAVVPNIVPPSTGCQTAGNGAGFFCDYVLDLIRKDPTFGPDEDTRERNLRTGGYSIYTTLNPELQSDALGVMNGTIPKSMDSIDIGSVITSVEVGTGRVLSMVLNKDYNNDPDAASSDSTAVNYATDYDEGGSTGFPVGSTYKVFVLTQWLKDGHGLYDVVNGNSRPFPLASFRNRCTGGDGGGSYAPKNDSGQTPGPMTVAAALRDSVNAAFITMTQQLDLCDIRNTATSLGVHRADGNELNSNPSDSLGTNEIAPITMAAAYAGIASGGSYCTPIAIDSITDANGAPVAVPPANCTQVLDPNIAAGDALAMRGSIEGGTSRPSNPWDGIEHIAKTGTTDQELHTWVVASSSKVSTAVWVGNVQGKVSLTSFSLHGTQGNAVRHDLMRPMLAGIDQIFGGDDFPAPHGSAVGIAKNTVPNVVGMSLSAAQQAVKDAGLTLVDGGAVDSEKPKGQVVDSDPTAGSTSGIGGTVSVHTSNGELAVLPSVVGTTVEQATAALQAQGWLVGGTRTQRTGPGCNPAVLMATDPPAGSVARASTTTVTFTVCSVN